MNTQIGYHNRLRRKLGRELAQPIDNRFANFRLFILAVFYPTNLTALTTQCGLARLRFGPGPEGPAKKEWTLVLNDCPAPQQECCWINRPAGSQTGYTHTTTMTLRRFAYDTGGLIKAKILFLMIFFKFLWPTYLKGS